MTPRLLAFDTTGFSCSAAFAREGAVVAARHEAMERGQSERLMPMIEEVMAEAGAAYAELDLIAVTRGPGAFTGLRLGLAAGRALGLAVGCPVVGVTSFAAVYHTLPAETRAGRAVWVLIDSKRSDLYLQRFDAEGGLLGAPAAVSPADLAGEAAAATGRGAGLLLAGNGAARLHADLPADSAELSPVREASAAGWTPWAAASLSPTQTAPPQPLYLRPPDVSFPKARA